MHLLVAACRQEVISVATTWSREAFVTNIWQIQIHTNSKENQQILRFSDSHLSVQACLVAEKKLPDFFETFYHLVPIRSPAAVGNSSAFSCFFLLVIFRGAGPSCEFQQSDENEHTTVRVGKKSSQEELHVDIQKNDVYVICVFIHSRNMSLLGYGRSTSGWLYLHILHLFYMNIMRHCEQLSNNKLQMQVNTPWMKSVWVYLYIIYFLES